MNDFDENVLQQGEEKEFPWQDVLELTNGSGNCTISS